MYCCLWVFPNWMKTSNPNFVLNMMNQAKEWEENRNPADDAGIKEENISNTGIL